MSTQTAGVLGATTREQQRGQYFLNPSPYRDSSIDLIGIDGVIESLNSGNKCLVASVHICADEAVETGQVTVSLKRV